MERIDGQLKFTPAGINAICDHLWENPRSAAECFDLHYSEHTDNIVLSYNEKLYYVAEENQEKQEPKRIIRRGGHAEEKIGLHDFKELLSQHNVPDKVLPWLRAADMSPAIPTSSRAPAPKAKYRP